MKGFYICFALAQLLHHVSSAGSYDVVPFEHMTSPHRVIIGVPADDLLGEGKDSDRVLYRRNKIIDIVDKHVDRMAESTTNIHIDSIQYAFVSSLEYAFTQIFPKHTESGIKLSDDLDEPLPTPAIRLTNINTNEKMQPDYPILLSDLPEELDRLVNDYERWQSLTNDIIYDRLDHTIILHSKNLINGLNNFDHMITMFYAPWCHYSQLMLPKFSKTFSNINSVIDKGYINKNMIGLGKVNVDQEGEMKMFFNISTYPTLKFINGNNKKIAKRPETIWSQELFPTYDFNGDIGTSADMTSHILSLCSWPKKLKHGNLILDLESSDGYEGKSTKKSNITIHDNKFINIINMVDKLLIEDNMKIKTKHDDEEEEDDDVNELLGESKRAIVVLTVFPNDFVISKKSKLTSKISNKFAGNNKFIGSISEKDIVKTLTKLTSKLSSSHENSNEEEDKNHQDQENRIIKLIEESKETKNNQNGYIVVYKAEFDSVIFHEIPTNFILNHDNKDGDDNDDSFMKWINAATWPSISKFNPNAAQGERIQKSHVKNLCLLFGNENDFMYEEYKLILESISNDNIGFAHYLYTNYNEMRLTSMLKSLNVNSETMNEPMIVLVSMINEFKPYKIIGNKINYESMNEMIQSIQTPKNIEL
mmetsp:Transcript_9221/g.11085  ORF Transcript_9221/g.11085 Transcript_9221/m.11085 type:complete len:647 (-) Transcript_9221:280-2220(-)